MTTLDFSQRTISLSLDELTQRVEAFLAAWERLDAPPAIADYLPAEPAALRKMVLSELAKTDLEQRASRGLAARVDQYVELFPELAEKSGEPPCDLIYEEFHVRRAAGETIQVEEYYERFPKSAEGLKRLLPATPDATTALGRRKQLEEMAPGQKVDDFELLAFLGKGAFASVFLARQLTLQRLVALKVSADRGSETQTLAQLDHPNIVRVFDQRRLPDRRLKLLYMQYAPGGTLEDVVTRAMDTPRAGRNGKLVGAVVREAQERSGMLADDGSSAGRRFKHASWPETVCRIGAQLASALDYAHRQGILHRDVKPANVLLAADGTPKLADFNISFCSQLDGATPAAYFGGSLAYMSPEQLEACNPHHPRQPEDLDGRSDLFSLAVLLWEMLFGQRPFQDASVEAGWTATLEQMVKRRRSEAPVVPKHLADDELTRAVAGVLLKAMSADIDERYADGAAMARDLQLCLQPRVKQMLTTPRQGLFAFLRRWPYWAFVAMILLPNALGGFLNQRFNWHVIFGNVEEGPSYDAMNWAFHVAMFIVNAIAFPLGIAVGSWILWPLCATLARVRRGEQVSADELTSARKLALRFGEYAAWLGAIEWAVTGFIFPPFILFLTGPIEIQNRERIFGLFVGSQIVSGLIAAAFPYFGATWLGVRAYYPALLDGKPIDPEESRLLLNVSSRSYFYLLVAALVPLVGMSLLGYSRITDKWWAYALPLAVSLGALFVAYRVLQSLRADVAALSLATRPVDAFGTSSESLELE
jgi:serine/threonine protein kinase